MHLKLRSYLCISEKKAQTRPPIVSIGPRGSIGTFRSYCKPCLEEHGTLCWPTAEMTHLTVWICAWFLAVCMFWVKTGETALDQARENDNPEVALLLTKAPQVRKHTHTHTHWRAILWQEKVVVFFLLHFHYLLNIKKKKILFSLSFRLGINTIWIALAQWLVAHVHILHKSNGRNFFAFTNLPWAKGWFHYRFNLMQNNKNIFELRGQLQVFSCRSDDRRSDQRCDVC